MTNAFILDNQGVTHLTKLPAWNPEYKSISIRVGDDFMDVELVRVTNNGIALFREV